MTSTSPQSRAQPPTAADEIDLRELAFSLWASRRVVCIITLLVTAIAAAYAFLSQPVYQSSAQTLPPPASSLSGYNAGSHLLDYNTKSPDLPRSVTLPQLTPQTAYEAFLRHLASDRIRTQFFENTYLPAHAGGDSQAQRDALWQRMAREIVVTLPKQNMDIATLTVEGHDPNLTAEWTNQYMQQAIAAAREELILNLDSAAKVASQIAEEQIKALRTVAAAVREARLARLKDALRIAENIGLDDPPQSGNLITSYDGENLYLRGARAIRAEISQLEARTSDDPYIEELPEVLRNEALLSSIDTNPGSLEVATIDRSALVPEDPIKPKKALILALGIVLGGMLGVFTALARAMFRRPKASA